MEAIISVTAVFSVTLCILLGYVMVRSHRDLFEFEQRLNNAHSNYHPAQGKEKT
jgi:hypothetical protein